MKEFILDYLDAFLHARHAHKTQDLVSARTKSEARALVPAAKRDKILNLIDGAGI